jgi:hypothetical protein
MPPCVELPECYLVWLAILSVPSASAAGWVAGGCCRLLIDINHCAASARAACVLLSCVCVCACACACAWHEGMACVCVLVVFCCLLVWVIRQPFWHLTRGAASTHHSSLNCLLTIPTGSPTTAQADIRALLDLCSMCAACAERNPTPTLWLVLIKCTASVRVCVGACAGRQDGHAELGLNQRPLAAGPEDEPPRACACASLGVRVPSGEVAC